MPSNKPHSYLLLFASGIFLLSFFFSNSEVLDLNIGDTYYVLEFRSSLQVLSSYFLIFSLLIFAANWAKVKLGKWLIGLIWVGNFLGILSVLFFVQFKGASNFNPLLFYTMSLAVVLHAIFVIGYFFTLILHTIR